MRNESVFIDERRRCVGQLYLWKNTHLVASLRIENVICVRYTTYIRERKFSNTRHGESKRQNTPCR